MDRKIGKKPIIALAIIIVIIVVIALVVTLNPKEDLSGSLSDQASQAVQMERVSNGIEAFDNVNGTAAKMDIQFEASDADGASKIDKNLSSHIQGYARYRGNGYDFHIFPYSNLSGEKGYVWFVSDTKKFYIKLPQTTKKYESDIYYNHPTGVQIIGDYLVVGVIPADGSVATADFYQPSDTYLIDLSPLKESKPSTPTRIKKINELSYIKDTSGYKVGSLSCVGVIDFNGKYLIGYIADNTLAIYESNECSNIWEATSFTLIRTYGLKHGDKDYHYQSMGLYGDNAGDIYMVGLDTRSGKDYCDLFKLTRTTDDGDIVLIENKAHSPYTFLKEKHVKLDGGAEFSYGGGLEVYKGDLYLYGTESYAKDDGNATINILSPSN